MFALQPGDITFPAPYSNDKAWILGDRALRKLYLIFDAENQKVGMIPANDYAGEIDWKKVIGKVLIGAAVLLFGSCCFCCCCCGCKCLRKRTRSQA